MIRNFILGLAILICQSATAQSWIVDSVTMSPSYVNDVYYSFVNDSVVSTSPNATWDLAFFVSQSGQSSFSASVMANHAQPASPGQFVGMQVFSMHKSAANWSTLTWADTIGVRSNPLWNDEVNYNYGAFNQNRGTNPFDFGWGFYNSSNHNLYGDSIYLIKKGTSYFKLIIDSLTGATSKWNFRIANYDGTGEHAVNINGAGTFATKLFAYYDIEANAVIDREPAKNTWDVNFSKFAPLITYGTYTIHYALPGVLANRNYKIAKIENTVPETVTPWTALHTTLENNYSKMAWDWRKPGTNDTIGNLSYLMMTTNDTTTVYQIVYDMMGSNTTGNIKFQFRKLSVPQSILSNNHNVSSIRLYPNPMIGEDIFLSLSSRNNIGKVTVTILNLTGQVMSHSSINLTEGANAFQIDGASKLQSGMYILRLNGKDFDVSTTFLKK